MRKTKQKKFSCKNMKNLKMNEETYKLRRRVIDLIYEAKSVTDFKRVNVRITQDGEKEELHTLGIGGIGKQEIIWIPKRMFKMGENDLRYTVYHELVHTICKKGHEDNDILMGAYHPGASKLPTKAEIQKAFKRHIEGGS